MQSSSISETSDREPIVRPEELLSLPNGSCYLKSMSLNPHLLKIKNKRWNNLNGPYVPKAIKKELDDDLETKLSHLKGGDDSLFDEIKT